MLRDKLVVIDECILAVIFPERPKIAQILRASILMGSIHHDGEIIYHEFKKVRLASEADFDKFRVSFKGFDNKEQYEYDEKKV